MSAAPASGSRLRRLAAPRAAAGPAAGEERCELCGEPIPADHRHLLDLERQRLLCGCRACALLFDQGAAGRGRYRLVPERVLYLARFDLDDAGWSELGIPVELAFLFRSSRAGRVLAVYPGPLGATESLLALPAWTALEARNPVLGRLRPDVEALLVNRARGARDHWIVPVDRAYALVGLIRAHWRGLAGGQEVWDEIDGFLAALRSRAKVVTADGKEATWPGSGSESRA